VAIVMFKPLSILKICLSIACWLPIPVMAQSIDGVTIFGDSLSDPGNAAILTGGVVPPSPPYFNGRFSNGPVWVEGFPVELKLPATAIDNFAFGGATSGTNNTVSSPLLPGLTTELDRFLITSPKLDPNRLFIIWAGANDYLGGGVTNPAIVVGNISTAVSRLTAAGAQQLIVVNLPDLGKIPAGAADPAQSAALSGLSAAHNSGLRASLQTIAQNNPNVSIIPTDLAALFNAAITNPARFGLTNVTQPCLNQLTATVCATPDTYLFWDPLHPTAAGHRLISAYALDTVIAQRAIAIQTETALGSANRQTRDLNSRLLALRTTSQPIDGQIGVFATGDSNFGDRLSLRISSGYDFGSNGLSFGPTAGIRYSKINISDPHEYRCHRSRLYPLEYWRSGGA
jgi:outer membrane lipase/esterase